MSHHLAASPVLEYPQMNSFLKIYFWAYFDSDWLNFVGLICVLNDKKCEIKILNSEGVSSEASFSFLKPYVILHGLLRVGDSTNQRAPFSLT